MPRIIVAVFIGLFFVSCAVASDSRPGRTINLNKPGALEALQRSNPAHYDKVRKILDRILQKPDAAVPRWIQTNFDAQDVIYRPVLLTTDPPQKRLSFSLDDARYEAVVTITNMRVEIVPLPAR